MHKILIANRGEIARRIIRTCREMGLATVAVYSEADRDALFVAEADEAVPLGGNTPAESYLRGDALVAAAQQSGADAVHPGYGFLSENAAFARRVVDAGLSFIGPTPEAIAAMGSKIEAKRRVQAAGVPVLSSVEAGDRSAGQLAGDVERLGFPVLIKASAGGGGRGMRIVRQASELAPALEAARREAQSAFGDGAVFIEPYVENPRHIEIQIFGDQQGRVVHLFERECSIQRRHQKILEEAPSVALTPELRAEMGSVAAKAGASIGYVGAGTVEFLFTPQGKFFFLEVNTRLQVEHPVTECITGLDLVRLQIEVAQGQPLPPAACEPKLSGHAIEVRLYAEDPRHDYRPQTGTLHRFRLAPEPGLRVETGVADGSAVSPYYDPMLAKVIAWAPTRSEAARRLARALRRAQIHGVQTNRELLVRLLEHPEYLAGRTDTHFLERFSPVELGAPLGDRRAEQLHAAAAALAAQAQRRRQTVALGSLPSGWRNSRSQLQEARYAAPGGEVRVGYALTREGLQLALDGEPQPGARLGRCTAQSVELEVDGLRRGYAVHQVGTTAYVDSPLGSSELVEVERFPLPEDEAERGSLVAPFPGVVAEIKVAVGAEVAVGDPLVVIESMKMLHPVTAPVAGRVSEVRVAAAAHVEAGAILVLIDDTAGS